MIIGAVRLYFKYGRKATAVLREQVYPTERNFRRRVPLWETNGSSILSVRCKPRDSAEQKKMAV